jgi:hypothetical protein
MMMGLCVCRTQFKNREDCLSKLRVMIVEAMIVPKERNMRTVRATHTPQERSMPRIGEPYSHLLLWGLPSSQSIEASGGNTVD